MEHHTSASIEILGTELRYAEVERDGDSRRLVRLGSCSFDFELEDVISGGQEGEWTETLEYAVRDILAGSSALDLHVALHPPLGSSLFVPIPVDMSKKERLKRLWQDVAVAFPGEETAFSTELIRPEVLTDGENIEWWHVLAVPANIAKTLEEVLRRIEAGRLRFCASMSGAAAVLRHLARSRVEETPVAVPYRIGIGRYAAHTEFVLMRNQAWQFGATFSARVPSDRLYMLQSLLEGLNVSVEEVLDIYTYGCESDETLVALCEAVFGRQVTTLDPLSVVDHQVDGLTSGLTIQAYAPCVGANLRDVYP